MYEIARYTIVVVFAIGILAVLHFHWPTWVMFFMAFGALVAFIINEELEGGEWLPRQ